MASILSDDTKLAKRKLNAYICGRRFDCIFAANTSMLACMSPRSALVAALLAASAVFAGGCGPGEVCHPASQTITCTKPVEHSATIGVPPGVVAPSTTRSHGHTCLALDGSCSIPPSFWIVAELDPIAGSDDLYIGATVPAGQGPASYAVSSSDVHPPVVIGHVTLGDPGSAGPTPLTPISGTIVVEDSAPDILRVSFEMQLETPDHRVYSVSNGHFEIGCRIVPIPAGCIDRQ